MQDDYIHGKRPHHTWPERKQQRGGGGVPPGHHYSIKKSDHATQDLFNPILNVIKPLSSRDPRRNCTRDIGVLGVATQSQPVLFLAFLVADAGCTGHQPQLSHKIPPVLFHRWHCIPREKCFRIAHVGVLSKGRRECCGSQGVSGACHGRHRPAIQLKHVTIRFL